MREGVDFRTNWQFLGEVVSQRFLILAVSS
jgi:hypothetical protein